jgi:hypothetical protein
VRKLFRGASGERSSMRIGACETNAVNPRGTRRGAKKCKFRGGGRVLACEEVGVDRAGAKVSGPS